MGDMTAAGGREERRRSRGVAEGSTPGRSPDRAPVSGQASAYGDTSVYGHAPTYGQVSGREAEVSGNGTQVSGPEVSEYGAEVSESAASGYGSTAEGSGRGGRRGRGRGARRSADPEPPRDPYAAAREIALRQLSDGPRTRVQLQRAMSRKQIPDDVMASVLDRYEEVDLIDDAEFARQWVESRHAGRGLARRALAYELRQRGVAEETVKSAVDELSTSDELSTARELVRRKASSMRNDDPQRRMRRLAGMLARKGYGSGVAMQAIREELADLEAYEDFSHPDPDDV